MTFKLPSCILDNKAKELQSRHLEQIYYCQRTKRDKCKDRFTNGVCLQSPLFMPKAEEIRKDDH